MSSFFRRGSSSRPWPASLGSAAAIRAGQLANREDVTAQKRSVLHSSQKRLRAMGAKTSFHYAMVRLQRELLGKGQRPDVEPLPFQRVGQSGARGLGETLQAFGFSLQIQVRPGRGRAYASALLMHREGHGETLDLAVGLSDEPSSLLRARAQALAVELFLNSRCGGGVCPGSFGGD